MGQVSTKGLKYGETDILESIHEMCTAAEKMAASRCGKLAVDVFRQSASLKDLSQQCLTCLQQAGQLVGDQVYAVAMALQALHNRLEWCKRKLHQRHLITLNTLTRRQQAAHITKVLAVARDAIHNFTTAFQLAVMLSTTRPSEATSAHQQQHQATQQEAVQQELSQDQPVLACQPDDLQQPLQAADGSHCTGDHTGQPAEVPQAQLLQPTNTPSAASAASAAPPMAEEQLHTTSAQLHSPVAQACAIGQEGCSAGPPTAASIAMPPAEVAAPSPPPPPSALPAAAAAATHPTATDTEGTAVADGVLVGGQGPCVLAIAAAEEWEHSAMGWQGLLQRAWAGEVGAVLACAQQLIHGGDFCPQDCGLARRLLHTVAGQSCSTACLWLGQLAEQGLGLPAPDYTLAADWYGRGAALGHPEAAHALAFYYQHGLGVDQDNQAALEWYQFAAAHGIAAAQNNLGQLLLQGGSTADVAAAVELFEAAAEGGSATAWYNLGACYELGLAGSGPDAAAAEACYQQAATPNALLRLGRLYLQHHHTSAAREAFAESAAAGCAEALLHLANLMAPTPCAAVQQQQQDSVGLHTVCQVSGQPPWAAGCDVPGSLASTVHNSGLTDKDAKVATSLTSTSTLGFSAAAEAAMQLYQQAADAGVAEAQHMLGCMSWQQGNARKALDAWHAAGAQGHGPSLLCLAAAADGGLQGVPKDPVAARACYAMAAACGSSQGGARLAALDHEAALQSNSERQPWLA